MARTFGLKEDQKLEIEEQTLQPKLAGHIAADSSLEHMMQCDPPDRDEPSRPAIDREGETLRADLLADLEHARALREQSNSLSEMLMSLWRKFGR